MLEAVAPPQRARLERRHDVVGKARIPAEGFSHAWYPAAEQPALGGDEWGCDLVPVTAPQSRAQIAQAIDQAEALRRPTNPIFPGKQGGFWTGQLGPATRLDERDEALVDLVLHGFEPLHVVRLLRQERVEHHLVLARRVKPPLDANALDQFVQAE